VTADLLSLTADLVAIPSVSHAETALADRVEHLLRTTSSFAVHRVGANVVARSDFDRQTRVVLAGHLDTVPANGNADPRIEGDTLWGLGSADMKGGLAVLLELAAALHQPPVDVTLVFYSGEEVAREHNGLLAIAAEQPELLAGDAAILGEPTSGQIEAGCQGVLKMQLELGGVRAHTARPWMGVNAVHRLAPVLRQLSGYEPRQPVIDGCRYRESVQAVEVRGGVAGNVVPDQASLLIGHRFAPDRDPAAAEASMRAWLEPLLDLTCGDRISVLEVSPAAAPSLGHPVLAALLEATGTPPRAKLGWTDAAFFAERGIPAVNFGPGDPELAHTQAERVQRRDLERVYQTLFRLLSVPLRSSSEQS
jgi:succinyl-diaminopimelate desuccinylase